MMQYQKYGTHLHCGLLKPTCRLNQASVKCNRLHAYLIASIRYLSQYSYRSTPVVRVQVWVRACQEYSYRRKMDTTLRGVVQLQSMPLCGISH